jgi:hypothetical protein
MQEEGIIDKLVTYIITQEIQNGEAAGVSQTQGKLMQTVQNGEAAGVSQTQGKLMQAVKYSVLRDVTPCGSCKNRRFGGT